MEYDWECETCSRMFCNRHAVNQHMDALGHWAPTFDCETCDREFKSEHAAEQHMRALNHFEPHIKCETCPRKFHDNQSVNRHMYEDDHWPSSLSMFVCEWRSCTKVYRKGENFRNHMEEYRHWHCSPCDREFDSEHNLRQHLHSRTHQDQRLPCPFCNAAYTTASGLSHHLESGSCSRAPQLNRATIYKAIKSRDPHGVITQKLLTYRDIDMMENIATNACWNGSYFECYLCHRGYRALRDLNQHLSSPAHQQKLYHCPSRTCGKQFVNLAGMFNHLESESCGAMRFETVRGKAEGIFTGQQKLVGFV